MTTLPNNTVAGSGAQPAPQGTVPPTITGGGGTIGTVAVPASTNSLDEITTAVSVALNEFGQADAKRKIARTDAEHAADAAIGERERLLRRLSGVAHAAAWAEDDLSEAVKKAIERHAGNDKSKKSSLATFASEIKLACHRQVRAHVSAFFDTAREAWDDERAAAEGEGEAPEPLRKAWSRMYHVVVQGMMRAAKDGTVITDADGLVEHAERTIRERQIDYKRVKARLASMVKELKAFHADFPEPGLAECVKYMSDVTESDLEKAHARVDTSTAPAPIEDAVETTETTEDAPEPQTTEDLISDALNDMHAQAA